MIQHTKQKRVLFVLSGLIVLVLIGSGGLRLHKIKKNPKIPFVSSEKDAQWIKHDAPFNLVAHDGGIFCAEFRRRFKKAVTIENANISIRAMKQCTVFFDGKQIYISSENVRRKYGTTGPLIVKGRHKPIKLMRQGGT